MTPTDRFMASVCGTRQLIARILLTAQVDWLGLRVVGHPALSLYIHQMNRMNSRTNFGHDSTINIVVVIIIIIIRNRLMCHTIFLKAKVAHTRLASIGFRS